MSRSIHTRANTIHRLHAFVIPKKIFWVEQRRADGVFYPISIILFFEVFPFAILIIVLLTLKCSLNSCRTCSFASLSTGDAVTRTRYSVSDIFVTSLLGERVFTITDILIYHQYTKNRRLIPPVFSHYHELITHVYAPVFR